MCASSCLLFFSSSFQKAVPWVTGSPSAANTAFLRAGFLTQPAAAASQLALVCLPYVRAYCWPCRDQTEMIKEKKGSRTKLSIPIVQMGVDLCSLPFLLCFALIGMDRKKYENHSLGRKAPVLRSIVHLELELVGCQRCEGSPRTLTQTPCLMLRSQKLREFR